ncbi:MAG: low temperature requirement protein A [Acidimicrobiia bacterium]
MVSVAQVRPRTSDEPQGATWIELFFDLVFVYALTQVTSLLLHDLTWSGAARAVVVGWLVWWAWTQFTWTLSPADTTHPVVEVVVLVATAVAFFMARSVVESFTGNPWLFLVPYLVIRGIGMGLYGWVGGAADRQMARSMGLFALASVPAILALVVGAFLDPGPRAGMWALAIVLDLAAGVAVRGVSWRIHVSHFSERHGLFVIIALGESLIAIGVASTALDATVASYLVKAAAVALVCAMWWVYFGWFKSWLEERAEASGSIDFIRNAYSFVHFPVVIGVVGVAASLEVSLAHPEEAFSAPAAASLVLGTAGYVGGVVLLAWMAGRIVLKARLALLATIGVFSVVSVALEARATLVIAFAAAALVLIAILEYPSPVRAGPE